MARKGEVEGEERRRGNGGGAPFGPRRTGEGGKTSVVSGLTNGDFTIFALGGFI